MLKRSFYPLLQYVCWALFFSAVLFGFHTGAVAYAYTVPQTSEVTLAWDANDPTPEGYRIFQRIEGQAYDYAQPCWTGSATSGTVYNLDGDTTYFFVVRAFDGDLQSADSEEVSFHTPASPTPTYSISTIAGDHGSISPSGALDFAEGADQTFTMSPDTGYHIVDVLVDGVSHGAISSYTFSQIDADHTIEVLFAANTHTISAAAGENGTISPVGDSQVAHGSSCTYTIAPNIGFHIANVLIDGVAQGAIPSYTFENVTSDHTITASFAVNAYTISASEGVNGSVSPSGITHLGLGDSQTYTVTPDIGYQIADVRVDGASVGAVASYPFESVDADHTIDATFVAQTYTISATAGENGSINPSGSFDVVYGESQTFVFSADPGYRIADVQVDGQSVGAVRSYTLSGINENHSITVRFAEMTQVKIWIEAEEGDIYLPMEVADDETASSGGYMWVPSGNGTYKSPSADAGRIEYHFEVPETGDYIIWAREISNDTASDSFFVSMDGEADMVWHTKQGGQDVWTWDVFSVRSWDDPRDADTPHLFHLDAGAHTLTIRQRESGAKLDRILITNDLVIGSDGYPTEVYTITSTAGEHGAISPEGAFDIEEGASQKYTITPDDGYHIADVLVDGLSVGAVATYIFSGVEADHTIHATFAVDTFTIATSADDNGTITPSGIVDVNYGASQTFTIAPDSGYHVADVIVDGASQGAVPSYTFNQIAASHSIHASFAVNTYTISALAGANGSIFPSGNTQVSYGGSQTYEIQPAQGYRVADVLVNGVSQGQISSYTFDQVAADQSIRASFVREEVYFTVSSSAGANGSISPAGSISVASGASQTYTITPDAGCHIANVSVDGVSVGAVSSYTFNKITSNHTISAAFEADTFAIFAVAGENGGVSPNGIVDATLGCNRTFVFTAAPGFHVADVLVDGRSVGVADSYTFSDVCADHTLEVSFAANTDVEIWIEAEDGDIQWPMEIGDDPAAGAGGYVWVPEGAGGSDSTAGVSGGDGSAVGGYGYAEYHIDVPEAGDYIIWARQVSNDGASDSFYVSMDGMEKMVWHTKQGGQDVWTWDAFAIREASNPDYTAAPMIFQLAAGAHTLRISQREDGTKLDQIVVTNQLDKFMAEPSVVADLVEYGEIELDHNWVRVNFAKSFVNPVVVAGPISLNGSAPAVVRIRNVDTDGFEVRIQEWDYQDGVHATETVSYLAMEQGRYSLEDGTQIEAAVLETNADNAFERISFRNSFSVAPVVFSSLNTYNGSDAVTGRLKNVAVDGFEYRMQEQEASAQSHNAEMMGYIAWEPSSGTLGDVAYSVGKTANAVKHKLYNIGFDASFDAPPVFLGNMQTTDGGDTANVRYTNKSGVSVDVFIDEEKSKNTETRHTSEVVGYMALAR